jgi:hypothetical protein
MAWWWLQMVGSTNQWNRKVPQKVEVDQIELWCTLLVWSSQPWCDINTAQPILQHPKDEMKYRFLNNGLITMNEHVHVFCWYYSVSLNITNPDMFSLSILPPILCNSYTDNKLTCFYIPSYWYVAFILSSIFVLISCFYHLHLTMQEESINITVSGSCDVIYIKH